MIIIFNGVCNYGVVIAELCARFNMPYKLYSITEISKEYLNQFLYVRSENIHVNDRVSLIQDLRSTKLCINVSMGAIDILGLKGIFLHIFMRKIKVINIPTGSDFSEIEIEMPVRKLLFLALLKLGSTHIPHYSYCLRNYLKYKIKKVFFGRHPYILQPKKTHFKDNKEIIFLHASNLDWGETDCKVKRNSLKNNIVFLRAFIKAANSLIQKNIIIKCYILDRGPDKELAKKIISIENAEQFFEWLPSVTTTELTKYLALADIVVDQFYLGIFGMTAMEAMAQAKPVMIYIDKNCWPLVYNDEPPMINCRTEDEIYDAILTWIDHEKIKELGERSEKWVRQYHDVHQADFSELILRICKDAQLEWPREDLKNISCVF